ncbi:MAG: 2-oxo acid dehydrogenase subunit E2 [Flavobacteriaceae bacterium]|nr:2-oxo acid dehydrogenase subunit E2 [Flavobacteriaceae bacterium]
MSKFELKLPKMGESVAEATITSWLKEVGDMVELDEAVVEIATDKVDSEVPSEVEGILVEKLFEVDDVVQVGQTIAIIELEGEATATVSLEKLETESEAPAAAVAAAEIEQEIAVVQEAAQPVAIENFSASDRFYSPLVKNIAKQEGISMTELDAIPGTGKDGRLTKKDLKKYLENGRLKIANDNTKQPSVVGSPSAPKTTKMPKVAVAPKVTPIPSGEDEIIEMTRMGKLIAHHMQESVRTSAHVQSFIEVDVTNVVLWRKKVKDVFLQKTGEKLTFTPIFMEAIAKALGDFPMMNISVDGDHIIKKSNINLGMAAALPDGNLIVPVIKNADQLNMVGMAKAVNDLANRARANALKPDEIQGGTYTVTNVGSFGSVFGTPIINQPQVGILALGAIRKMPAVIETADGDFIGIRQKMFLSHSYDHRVVNGALGGSFIKAIKEYLEAWNMDREV